MNITCECYLRVRMNIYACVGHLSGKLIIFALIFIGSRTKQNIVTHVGPTFSVLESSQCIICEVCNYGAENNATRAMWNSRPVAGGQYKT